MKYLCAMHSDAGIRKTVNQDSLCILEGKSDKGTVLLAAVCDGMGGLNKGELASTTVIRALTVWFEQELPGFLEKNDPMDEVRFSWERMIKGYNQRIREYGTSQHLQLGTTLTAMLFFPDGRYLIGHVGDSRGYQITDTRFELLTDDQTVTANEVRLGRMTPEQAEQDARSHVLLQCIGASKTVIPTMLSGTAQTCSYLLCSDGFRHEMKADELHAAFSPSACTDETVMKQKLTELVEVNKQRGETDNISAMLIRVM